MVPLQTAFDRLLAANKVDPERLARELKDASPPSRRYLIYMTPRTGSSWLRDVLRSTNRLGWPEEWFNLFMLEAFARDRNVNTLRDYGALLIGGGQSENGVFGATITWNEISALWPDAFKNPSSDFFDLFPVEETVAFALFRRDIVAQAVSLYRMMETGVFDSVNSTAVEREYAEQRVYYDAEKIRDCLLRIVDHENGMLSFFRARGIKPYKLIYEEMTAKGATSVARFFLNAVCPGDAPAGAPEALSRFRKIATAASGAFADRFHLDHTEFVDEIEVRRRDIFENADLITDTGTDSVDEVVRSISVGSAVRRPLIAASTEVAVVDPHNTVAPDIADEGGGRALSVVIPVYAGFRSVIACLKSVLEADCATPHRVLVLYDAGPDPRIERFLDALEARNLIELHKNDRNLGFVKTANRGFRLCGDDDVVLLNADTRVPRGWLDRMRQLALSDPRIATITPFTNNGEICSFPNFCEVNELPADLSVDDVDAHFAKSANSPQAIDIPTGVGFCMYISRVGLDRVGLFDENAFGRGYGEENDYCRRVAAAGLRNVLQTDLFVYHAGGVSFGVEKGTRVQEAVQKLDAIHPGYTNIVNEFCHRDPLRSFRFRMTSRCLAASPRPVVLLIYHGEGGGTRRYVHEVRRFYGEHISFLLLEPLREDWVRLSFPDWARSCDVNFKLGVNDDFLIDILRCVGVDRIHINHLRGIETAAMSVVEALGIDYVVTLHDYYFLAFSPSLTDNAGRYRPELYLPGFDESSADSRCDTAGVWKADGGKVSSERRARSERLLQNATRVVAPSVEAAAIYRKVFPDLKIDVQDHIGTELIQRFPPVIAPKRADVSGAAKRVVVIGALSPEKGADTLEAVANLAAMEGANIDFHLVGYAYRLMDKNVITHGSYNEDQLLSILGDIKPDLTWFPCRWPETYSYTLDAVMEARLPLVTPAIGALDSRTNGRPFTWKFDVNASPAAQLALIRSSLEELSQVAGEARVWEDQSAKPAFYKGSAYVPTQRGVRQTASVEDLSPRKLEELLWSEPPGAGLRSRVLQPVLWLLRNNRYAAHLWFRALPANFRVALRQRLIGR